MVKTLILHGWGGSDAPHWQAWLAAEIAKDYGTVSFPLLDNPHFPSKNRWIKQTKEILKDFRPDTVICHSLATALWFHLCHEGEIEAVKRLLLVAPPSLTCTMDTIKTFFPVTPPSSLFAEEAMLVVSDNDPYMDIAEAKSLKAALGIEMKIIPDGGHINTDAGYGLWPWVKEWAMQ